jgi:hypothetical protein
MAGQYHSMSESRNYLKVVPSLLLWQAQTTGSHLNKQAKMPGDK